MHMKELVFTLILLLQACGPLLAQTPTPVELSTQNPVEPQGILQRLTEKAREAKDKVQHLGETVLGVAGAYYEDHIQPVTHSYAEWASNVRSSVWEKIKTTLDDYMPLTAN